MDTPMGYFLSAASKGPVADNLCTAHGGIIISPVDYDEPEIIEQGMAIYKRKTDNQNFLGISFTTSSSVIVVLRTCAWPVESARPG